MCIDTYLTRLFYKKYKIDENYIPDVSNDPIPAVSAQSLIEEPEIVENDNPSEPEEKLYDDDEYDPNY